MEDIIERLDKILFWLEFIGKREAKEFMLECLPEPHELVLYQYSDGTNGYNELTQLARITQTKIKAYWDKWEEMELMIKIPAKGGERGKRKFNLIKLGIELPSLNKNKEVA